MYRNDGDQSDTTTLPAWEELYRGEFDVKTLTKDQCLLLAQETWNNPERFARFFFPELIPGRMPWLHKGILAILTKKVAWLENDSELPKIMRNFVYERDGEQIPIFAFDLNGKLELKLEKFTLLMIPRGYAKTTVAGIIYPLYNTVFQEIRVALYVSATATHANTQLANQKRQIESNQRLVHFFGVLKPSMQDSARWREDEFETTSGICWIARGRGGQVRGLNHNGVRPQIIVVDDLEDKEQVRQDEQRKKLKEWMYGDLMPCLPMISGGEMIVLGTLLHPDSLLMTLCMDPQWNVVKFGAYDKDGDLLWPENMDEKKLERERASATISGTLGAFYMERFTEVRVTEDSDFKSENLQYGSPAPGDVLFQSLYVDPAISEKKTADHATFTVAAASDKARLYIRHSSGGVGISPRAIVDKVFELYQQYQPARVGIESNAYQKALVYLIREEMFRRKIYFEVIPVTNTKEKFMRIKGILQPRYANKLVWHEGRFVQLEQQLLLFPHGSKDDYADGAAGAMSLLDDAAFMADNPDVKGVRSPDLEEEIGGDWRVAV